MQVKFQNNVTSAVDIFECIRVHHHVKLNDDGKFFIFDMYDRGGYAGCNILGPNADYTVYIQNDSGQTVDTLRWQSEAAQPVEYKPMDQEPAS